MRNDKVLLALAVVVFLGLGFLMYKTWFVPKEASMDDADEVGITYRSVKFNLNALDTKTINQSGEATITESPNGVLVVLSLEGYTAETPQPAHIHMGKCPKLGEVIYPLEDVVGGVSETLIDTSYDTFIGQLPMGINVHKSTSESDVYTACGDISLK